jgi:hypothetical protein
LASRVNPLMIKNLFLRYPSDYGNSDNPNFKMSINLKNLRNLVKTLMFKKFLVLCMKRVVFAHPLEAFKYIYATVSLV